PSRPQVSRRISKLVEVLKEFASKVSNRQSSDLWQASDLADCLPGLAVKEEDPFRPEPDRETGEPFGVEGDPDDRLYESVADRQVENRDISLRFCRVDLSSDAVRAAGRVRENLDVLRPHANEKLLRDGILDSRLQVVRPRGLKVTGLRDPFLRQAAPNRVDRTAAVSN